MVAFIWVAVGFMLGICVCAAPHLVDSAACRPEDDRQEDDFGIGA